MIKKYKYFIIVFLIIASFIAFGRILANDFINFDDNEYITENNHIKTGINTESIKWAFTAVVSSNWHPLTLLSHIMDWSLFGANASGHHLINLLLHIGSVLFLFLFLNRSTKSLWPSAFVAALFALHPLRVESVAWAAERKDVLSMFFGMATLYVYALYAEDHKLSKYFLCLILFALGLLAKPMLVTMPFVLMLLDYWPLERWQTAVTPAESVNVAPVIKKKDKEKRKADSNLEKRMSRPVQSRPQIIGSLLWEKAPFLFLAIISSLITLWAQNKGGSVVSPQKLIFADRIMNAIMSYVAYLGKIFWPVDLAVFYPYQTVYTLWQIFGSAFILLGISIAVVYNFKRAPFLSVGWFWYIGTLVPVIGLVQVGIQSMADRYTYFPSIGIAIILAWGINYLFNQKLRKIILLPAAVIIFASLTFLTWQQCGYWKNSISLFTHVLQVTEENYLAHINLGVALAAEGKKEEAIAHYREAFEINPTFTIALGNLCNSLAAIGKNDEVIATYLAAIESNPAYDYAHLNLGTFLSSQGRSEEAIDHYLQAIKINPKYDDAYYNLANLLMKQGKIAPAIDYYMGAVKINPDRADVHCDLADIFVQQNKIDQAIEHFREAVRITPSSFAALNNLGVNLERLLKHDEAIYYYRKAMLIEPKNPGIYFNLGVALGNKGELQEASKNFRQAINIKPDYEEAIRALKLALEIERQQKF